MGQLLTFALFRLQRVLGYVEECSHLETGYTARTNYARRRHSANSRLALRNTTRLSRAPVLPNQAAKGDHQYVGALERHSYYCVVSKCQPS